MRLSWERISLKLAGHFQTAKAIRADKQTIWVKVTHDGAEGWGEAVPMDTYAQSLESAEAALSQIAEFVNDQNPFELELITVELRRRFDDQLATVAAVDAALHDWVGRRISRPTWQILGLSAYQLPLTSYSMGTADLKQLEEKLLAAAQYPILKIKLGMADDEATMSLVRRVAPQKIIRVDANQGWSLERAVDKLKMLSQFGVEFVEQPLAAADLEGLARLREHALCPIVADESCVRVEDVPALKGRVDGINIKLSKCGGIRAAHKMIVLARALGLKVMLGCMIESSLGIAAALQLAPLADWLDLDGHLLLANDPFSGIGGQGGRLNLSVLPGLGVRNNN